MAWEDEYRDHMLWTAVTNAVESLSEVPAEEFTDDLARLRTVLSEIGGHAEQPHAVLSNEHLTAVKNLVDAVGASLPDSIATIFSPPPNNRNALSPFVQLTQQVRTWPATGSTSLRGLSKQAEQVEASFASLNKRLDERLSAIEAQATEQSKTVAASLEQQKADLAEQRTMFEALTEEKTTELQEELARLQTATTETDSVVEQQKARLDSALSSHQDKFSAAQEDRTQKWSSLLEDNEAKMQEHLEKMQEHEEQSQKVLSAVGVNATATDYGAYANDQAKAANRWRIGALIALSIAALAFLGAAGASFFGFGTDLDWWQVVFQKLGAPVGAAAVGYVLIRESGQHRREERAARQVQLTLTALEPFIANLPPEQKELIRVETARRIFAEQKDALPKAAARDAETDSHSNRP
ncbi:hypothetical protein GCM10009700_21160 [Brevibacterium sanguinis]|uniref:hypothetical protein n=1 Tax=Brevibacterium sanguinis TaxID=232444 RepID=UPI0031D36434